MKKKIKIKIMKKKIFLKKVLTWLQESIILIIWDKLMYGLIQHLTQSLIYQ